MGTLVIPCRSGFGKVSKKEAAEIVKNDIVFIPLDYEKYATRVRDKDKVKISIKFGNKKYMFPARVATIPVKIGKEYTNSLYVYFNDTTFEDFFRW